MLRQRENHESSKGKKVPNLQGKTDQVCSRPIHRNLTGQKGVAGYIQCTEPEFRITLIIIIVGVENRLESLSAEIKEVKNGMKLKML